MCGADARAAANTAPKYPESRLRARGLANTVTRDDESSCISNFQNGRLKARRDEISRKQCPYSEPLNVE